MILGIIAIALWIGSIIGYVIYNLYQKNIKLEEMVIKQSNFIQSLGSTIQESDKVIKELDTKIWTEGDRELASAFQNLRAIQEALNQYRLN
jgi:hypothetical protein